MESLNYIFKQLRNCEATEIYYQHKQLLEQNYENNLIPAQQYQTLVSGGWLNDEIMYAYVKLLQSCAFVMNSHFFTMLQNKKYDTCKKWLQGQKIQPQFSYLLCFPININNVHWIGLGIDFKNEIIIIADSMRGSHRDYANIIIDFLQTEQQFVQNLVGMTYNIDKMQILDTGTGSVAEDIKFINENECYAMKLRLILQLDASLVEEQSGNAKNSLELQRYQFFTQYPPRQNNCDDCGVFTLFFLKFFCKLSHGSGPEINKQMRYTIANELVRGEINYIDPLKQLQ